MSNVFVKPQQPVVAYDQVTIPFKPPWYGTQPCTTTQKQHLFLKKGEKNPKRLSNLRGESQQPINQPVMKVSFPTGRRQKANCAGSRAPPIAILSPSTLSQRLQKFLWAGKKRHGCKGVRQTRAQPLGCIPSRNIIYASFDLQTKKDLPWVNHNLPEQYNGNNENNVLTYLLLRCKANNLKRYRFKQDNIKT